MNRYTITVKIIKVADKQNQLACQLYSFSYNAQHMRFPSALGNFSRSEFRPIRNIGPLRNLGDLSMVLVSHFCRHSIFLSLACDLQPLLLPWPCHQENILLQKTNWMSHGSYKLFPKTFILDSSPGAGKRELSAWFRFHQWGYWKLANFIVVTLTLGFSKKQLPVVPTVKVAQTQQYHNEIICSWH